MANDKNADPNVSINTNSGYNRVRVSNYTSSPVIREAYVVTGNSILPGAVAKLGTSGEKGYTLTALVAEDAGKNGNYVIVDSNKDFNEGLETPVVEGNSVETYAIGSVFGETFFVPVKNGVDITRGAELTVDAGGVFRPAVANEIVIAVADGSIADASVDGSRRVKVILNPSYVK